MKIVINESVFEVDENVCEKIIECACGYIRGCGIYAISKESVVELKNETFQNKPELEEAVANYRKLGFEVYFKER